MFFTTSGATLELVACLPVGDYDVPHDTPPADIDGDEVAIDSGGPVECVAGDGESASSHGRENFQYWRTVTASSATTSVMVPAYMIPSTTRGVFSILVSAGW